MGRVSKKTINPDLQQKLDEQLHSLVASLTNKEDIEGFLDEFLTKEEKTMLAKRLLLYMMLLKNFGTEHIHATLSMSRETIRWYREIFATKGDRFRRQVEKQLEKSELQELWSHIEEIISTVIKSKTNMKARMKLLDGFNNGR